MTPNSPQQRPAAMLNVVGPVVAAAGIMIQYVSGVDYPTVPVAAKRSSRRAAIAARPHGAS